MSRRSFVGAVRVGTLGTFASVIAFFPLMLANGLQMASVCIRPFSKAGFRNINTWAAAAVWGWWVWLLTHVLGVKVKIFGDDLPDRENAIVIANHQGMVDIVALLFLAKAKDMIGHLKWLAKDILKYVPGIGWGMYFLDCIFLKRDWARDEQTIKKSFKSFVTDKIPVWLLSFPEGTRKTPEKLVKSRAYASARGMRPLENVLSPHPKGFVASVVGLREHVTAVYSVTIAYHGPTPSLIGLMIGECLGITIHVRRFPIGSLSKDAALLGQWLHSEFAEMDRLLGSYNPMRLS